MSRILAPMEAKNGDESSQKSHKSTHRPAPLPVDRAIRKLGSDIALARRRRRISQASLAERIGASQSTVKRMEAGDLRVPIHFVARTLHVFGEIEKLSRLLDTSEDPIGLSLMDEQLPRRIRARKPRPERGAL